MYQIDNSTVSSTLPAASAVGTAGYFTDGNPATGEAATVVPAEFLNMLMREMLGVVTAAGLTPSKTDATQLTAAIRTIAPSAGRLLGIRVFSTPGTSTYTPTAGTASVVVEVQGAGGGGGGTPATAAGQGASCGGGGSGAYGKSRITSDFSGVTVTVGAGGTAGAAGGNGGSGGSSSFGSLVSAPGGSGSGSATATSGNQASGGGLGGAKATGGTIINSKGAYGPIGMVTSGSAWPTGVGAASIFGGGGTPISGSGPGEAAQSPGAGASGAAAGASAAAQVGAKGGDGIVIVYEYA